MKMTKTLLAASLATACLAGSLPAQATNGYFLPGFGIRSMGMGGTGIASGEDAISAAANPANLIKVGHRMDIGVTLFNPVRSARVWDIPATPDGGFLFGTTGGQAADSDEELFPMPEFGFAMPFLDGMAVGVALVGNGGMNTTYRDNFFNYKPFNAPGQNYSIGVDLMQVLMPISAAFEVVEKQTVGASVVLAVQRFAAGGLQAFQCFDTKCPFPGAPPGGFGFTITSDPDHLTNKGFDWSYGGGIRLGWLGDFWDDRLSIGATWASKTYMTKFDRYRGLFAEQGDFDIPENYGVGFALKPNDRLTLAFDVMRIRYSGIPSVANRGPDATGNGVAGVPSMTDATKELGNDQGMGFGWTDQTVYKTGVEFKWNDKLTLRAGYNYGRSPIPDDQVTFNTLAPAVVEKHYSAGFTYKLDKDMELTGMYMYVASRNQTACGQNIIDCAEIGMHQNYLGGNVSWLF